MATYEYECPVTGDRVEVVESMKNPPPEWIGYREGDWWSVDEGEVKATISKQTRTTNRGVLLPTPNDKGLMRAYRRVYAGASVTPVVGVKMPRHIVPAVKGALPLSYAAQRRKTGQLVNRHGIVVRENPDGTHNTPDGIPICDTAENTQKHMDVAGTQWGGDG